MNERSLSRLYRRLAGAFVAACICLPAVAQDEEKKVAPPGLPAGFDWEFNFDASWGVFGFADSLYTNPKPEQPSGDLSDNWMEGSIKPALSAAYALDGSGEIYAKVSGVGVRTYSTPPQLVGDDASSFNVEDLYVGWRSGGEENTLDFTVGRAPYTLGHGLLLWDGAADGDGTGAAARSPGNADGGVPAPAGVQPAQEPASNPPADAP